MDRRFLESVTRELATSRSRRQVLGTAAKGTIGGVGAALAARGLGPSLIDNDSGLGVSAQEAACAPPPKVVERKSITALSAEELASLRLGVAEMKRRSQENPDDETGWLFQANLHALPAIPTPVPTWCQHNSWFFFPWHRMYLYRLERILQDAAGNPDLRLPYWNYSDDPTQRALPQALRDELDADGNPNSLHETRRATGMNDGTLELTEAGVVYSTSFLDKDFFPVDSNASHFGGERLVGPAFFGPEGGSLEGTPHGPVHNEVGGLEGAIAVQFGGPFTFAYHCAFHPSMTGAVNVVNDPALPLGTRFVEIVDFRFFPSDLTIPPNTVVQWINMGDTDHTITHDDGGFDSGPIIPTGYMALLELAARDPAFWLHHANVDRLWERWLALKDGRANPTGEPGWMNQTFPFYDVDGTKVHMAVSDVLDTKCLGYAFDDPLTEYEPDEPGGIGATPTALAAPDVTNLGESPADGPIVIGAEPVSIAVELAPAAEDDLARVATSAATPVAGARAPSLAMTLEGIENIAAPGITFAVYVNLPPDVEPDPNSDSFVGTIYTFVLRRHGDHQMAERGARQTFNITRAVQASQARADAPKGVTVTIVPTGAARIIEGLASPVPADAQPFVDAARGPWISVERVTVSATE